MDALIDISDGKVEEFYNIYRIKERLVSLISEKCINEVTKYLLRFDKNRAESFFYLFQMEENRRNFFIIKKRLVVGSLIIYQELVDILDYKEFIVIENFAMYMIYVRSLMDFNVNIEDIVEDIKERQIEFCKLLNSQKKIEGLTHSLVTFITLLSIMIVNNSESGIGGNKIRYASHLYKDKNLLFKNREDFLSGINNKDVFKDLVDNEFTLVSYYAHILYKFKYVVDIDKMAEDKRFFMLLTNSYKVYSRCIDIILVMIKDITINKRLYSLEFIDDSILHNNIIKINNIFNYVENKYILEKSSPNYILYLKHCMRKKYTYLESSMLKLRFIFSEFLIRNFKEIRDEKWLKFMVNYGVPFLYFIFCSNENDLEVIYDLLEDEDLKIMFSIIDFCFIKVEIRNYKHVILNGRKIDAVYINDLILIKNLSIVFTRSTDLEYTFLRLSYCSEVKESEKKFVKECNFKNVEELRNYYMKNNDLKMDATSLEITLTIMKCTYKFGVEAIRTLIRHNNNLENNKKNKKNNNKIIKRNKDTIGLIEKFIRMSLVNLEKRYFK